MNRIISISISGIIFNVDEDAYQNLKNYLDALHRRFTNGEGGEEILADIEARIAEILLSRLSDRKEVITPADVEYIIATMGQPEQLDEETEETNTYTAGTAYAQNEQDNKHTYKRLYRDTEDKWVGGVCSGISAYFDFDPLWLRIAFLIAILTFGTGIVLYIALWVLIPAARTSREKLEMRGEPVNISTIEKAVRENLGEFKNRLHNFQDEMHRQFSNADTGEKIKNFFAQLFDGLTSAFGPVVGALIKAVSIVIIVFSIFALAIIMIVLCGFNGLLNIHIPHMFHDLFANRWQLTLAVISLGLIIALPIFQVLVYTIRRLMGIRGRNRVLGYGFSALWILGVIMAAIIGIGMAQQFSRQAYYTTEYSIATPRRDTLYISSNMIDNQELRMDDMDDDDSYTDLGRVRLDIQRSYRPAYTLVKRVYARGSSRRQALAYAHDVQYNYIQQDSSLRLDESFRLGNTRKWRQQSVHLTLKVPVGKVIVLSEGTENILFNVDNVNNTYDGDMPGHKWKMTERGLECVDCNTTVAERAE